MSNRLLGHAGYFVKLQMVERVVVESFQGARVANARGPIALYVHRSRYCMIIAESTEMARAPAGSRRRPVLPKHACTYSNSKIHTGM